MSIVYYNCLSLPEEIERLVWYFKEQIEWKQSHKWSSDLFRMDIKSIYWNVAGMEDDDWEDDWEVMSNEINLMFHWFKLHTTEQRMLCYHLSNRFDVRNRKIRAELEEEVLKEKWAKALGWQSLVGRPHAFGRLNASVGNWDNPIEHHLTGYLRPCSHRFECERERDTAYHGPDPYPSPYVKFHINDLY